jgi:hypothetical protein
MNWKELTDEIMLDVAKLLSATPDIKYIVGIIQWNGKIISRPIYVPSPVEFVGGDDGSTTGMSVMLEPPNGWKPIKLPIVPKANGKPSAENMPIFYFLMKPNGSGLGIPSRFGNGRIGWSHNEEIIDYIGAELALIGTVTLGEVKQ